MTSKDSLRAYKAALLYLSENNIALQTANIQGDKFQITYGQSKFFEKTRSLGRTLDVLNQISPDYIDHYEMP